MTLSFCPFYSKVQNYRVYVCDIINMDNKCHFRIFMKALMVIKHRCFHVCVFVVWPLSELCCSHSLFAVIHLHFHIRYVFLFDAPAPANTSKRKKKPLIK